MYNITKEIVTVRNVMDHFHWVVENQKMDHNQTKFKVYIDSGEGSLKVLASITEKHNDPEVMISSLEQPNNRLSGVNRVLLLAYVEDIEESHHNMRIILDLLKFSNVNFKICADLKVVNILLGISSHGGKFACAFCYGESLPVAGPTRTFRHLKEQYEMYIADGAKKKYMQQYYNVINECLLQVDNLDVPTSTIIAQPELHYVIGVTNWVFNLSKKVLGSNKYYKLVE